ncbi:MAG: mandelate racemase/muconate lactonizing enzyme family protein [Gemmatimonadales bacterium]
MSSHRIGRARLWQVRMPLRMVYLSSMYIMQDTVRTVIELETADGECRGYGEAHGTAEAFALAGLLVEQLIGVDPFERQVIERRFARSVFDNRLGRIGWSVSGGIDLALWDLSARIAGASLSGMLGGSRRGPVDLVCPLPALILDRPVPRADVVGLFRDLGRVDAVVEYALQHAEQYGFRCFKYKSAAVSPDFDRAVMTALRERLPDAALRFDPNAGYPPAEAIGLCQSMDHLGLEFFEDPTDDQAGLARLRSQVRTPVATNMCIIQPDHLAAAVRSRPVDVILADLYLWGGVGRFRALVHAAEPLGFEVAIHSLFETGIGTAANLHLAAAFPGIRRANDCGHHVLGEDVVVPSTLDIRDGALAIPSGTGLGVELDPDRVRALAVQSREVA